MKPTIRKHKDVRGRKILGYTAEWAGFETYQNQPTPAAAAEALDAVIANALCDDMRPEIVSWRGWTYLVYWHPLWGWNDCRVSSPDGPSPNGPVHGSSHACCTRRQAIDSVRYNVAQLAFNVQTDTDVPEIVPDGKRGEFAAWIEFQQRYLAARNAGLSDVDAHSYAGRNPWRPDLASLSL